MHGARVIAESGGRITIGANCIVMENAVVRATAKHPCSIGEHTLIGPMAHVVGATIEDQVFIATGAAIFHGAIVERGAEVRIHAVVHLQTRVPAGATIPIAWVAVGDPAAILPPDKHDDIWKVQAPLHFPQWVYGVERDTPDLMVHVTTGLSQALTDHASDIPVAPALGTDLDGTSDN